MSPGSTRLPGSAVAPEPPMSSHEHLPSLGGPSPQGTTHSTERDPEQGFSERTTPTSDRLSPLLKPLQTLMRGSASGTAGGGSLRSAAGTISVSKLCKMAATRGGAFVPDPRHAAMHACYNKTFCCMACTVQELQSGLSTCWGTSTETVSTAAVLACISGLSWLFCFLMDPVITSALCFMCSVLVVKCFNAH